MWGLDFSFPPQVRGCLGYLIGSKLIFVLIRDRVQKMGVRNLPFSSILSYLEYFTYNNLHPQKPFLAYSLFMTNMKMNPIRNPISLLLRSTIFRECKLSNMLEGRNENADKLFRDPSLSH